MGWADSGDVLHRAAGLGQPAWTGQAACGDTWTASRASCPSRKNFSTTMAWRRRSSGIRCSMNCPLIRRRIRRQRFPHRPPVIGVIPGSRLGVAKENFRNLLEVCDRILVGFPQAKFLVPTMPATHEIVKTLSWRRRYPAAGPCKGRRTGNDRPVFDGAEPIQRIGSAMRFVSDRFRHGDASCGGARRPANRGLPSQPGDLASRGPVAHQDPHVFPGESAERQPPEIVPEFIPWYGSNQPVADKALEYLRNPRLLAEQRDRVRNLIRGLNRPGASRSAARLAVDLIMGRAATVWPHRPLLAVGPARRGLIEGDNQSRASETRDASPTIWAFATVRIALAYNRICCL